MKKICIACFVYIISVFAYGYDINEDLDVKGIEMMLGTNDYPAYYLRDKAWWMGLLRASETNWDDMDSFVFSAPTGRPFVFQRDANGRTQGKVEMIINDGNVGIGTTNVQSKLDVAGDVRMENLYLYRGAENDYSNYIKPTNFAAWGATEKYWLEYSTKGGHFFILDSDKSNTWADVFEIHAESKETTPLLKVMRNGNVGIGTSEPGNYKLAVEGTIGAREIVVSQGSWADFVFEPDYKLKTLPEVEAYIAANKHLPDMPSEAEVKEKGVNIGDIQAKLLQKIEELTLYVIELKKENVELQEFKKNQIEINSKLLKNN